MTQTSFGGSTAVPLAYQDPRAAVAVNLDGSDFHQIAYSADIPAPMLMVYSIRSTCWARWVRPQSGGTTSSASAWRPAARATTSSGTT